MSVSQSIHLGVDPRQGPMTSLCEGSSLMRGRVCPLSAITVNFHNIYSFTSIHTLSLVNGLSDCQTHVY
jgi:hypothetical protein